MDDRTKYEADLFLRYESRIVTLELRVEELREFMRKYEPIVDVLHETALVAHALSEKLEKARLGLLSRSQIAIGVAAIFVPPFLSAGLTLWIVKG